MTVLFLIFGFSDAKKCCCIFNNGFRGSWHYRATRAIQGTRLHAGINIYLRSLKKVVEFLHPHPRLILVPLVSKYMQLNIKFGGMEVAWVYMQFTTDMFWGCSLPLPVSR